MACLGFGFGHGLYRGCAHHFALEVHRLQLDLILANQPTDRPTKNKLEERVARSILYTERSMFCALVVPAQVHLTSFSSQDLASNFSARVLCTKVSAQVALHEFSAQISLLKFLYASSRAQAINASALWASSRCMFLSARALCKLL